MQLITQLLRKENPATEHELNECHNNLAPVAPIARRLGAHLHTVPVSVRESADISTICAVHLRQQMRPARADH